VEVAAMFFAATLSPILGFVMMATFLYSFVADHYQYLACIGPIALAAAGMQMGLGRIALRKPFLQPVLCGGLLLVLGALTWRQCGTYASEETLWRTTLERNPRSWMAANNLALILAREGKREDAILLFAESLSINPNNEKAINNLANTLAMDGRVPEAIAQFRKALKMNPRDADAHNNLGQILAMNGEVAEAIAQFHEAAIIQPDDFAILNNLAWWLATAHNATLRNGAEAVALAQKANVLTGGRNPRILLTLAAAFAEAGRYDEACDTARLAEQRATEQNNQGLARMLEQEIHLYKARIPLHQD
jgi:Flp pilus assembly protein TadD